MSTHVSHCDAWYSGRVQGVGFRAEVLAVARGFEVTGFVQNLADGRVWVHAEGSERENEAFLAAIAERLEGHVRGVETRTFVGLRTCPRFEIRT